MSVRRRDHAFSGALGVDATFLIVGAGAALAIGLALSAWLRGKKKVEQIGEEPPK